MYEWKNCLEKYQKCECMHSLFTGVPIMALTATAAPRVATKLEAFLNDPLVLTSTINRPNIYLACHQCQGSGPSRSLRFGLSNLH